MNGILFSSCSVLCFFSPKFKNYFSTDFFQINPVPYYSVYPIRMVCLRTTWKTILWLTRKSQKVNSDIPERTNFKFRVLAYRCLHGLGPEYFSENFRLVIEIHSRQRLRSASSTDVVVPATRRSSLGDRAFPVAGATAQCHLRVVSLDSGDF